MGKWGRRDVGQGWVGHAFVPKKKAKKKEGRMGDRNKRLINSSSVEGNVRSWQQGRLRFLSAVSDQPSVGIITLMS